MLFARFSNKVLQHISEASSEVAGQVQEISSLNGIEEWAATPKREIQESFTTGQVVEASSQIVETAPEVELKMKLDHVSVKGLLSDFCDTIHLAKVNGKYVLVIETETVSFEKCFSPIEFHKPDRLEEVLQWVVNK